MSRKSKTRKNVPEQGKATFFEIHWEKFVIGLLLVLPLIYFSSFLSADRMIGGSDYLIGGYPFEKWIGEQSELPLWYPHVFGGVPVLGSPVGGPLAPLAQLREIIPPNVVLSLSLIIFFFLAGLGMYLYLKAIGLSPYTSAVGAVIYQFIGNLATTPAAGHAGRAASIAVFPLMLFFIHSALKSKKLLYFLLMALTTAFAFYEGHFQITYYGLLFILGYVVYYLITHRKENTVKDLLKVFGYGALSVVLICCLMAAIWLPVLGGLGTAARGVERGYEYAASWAMPPIELADLFIPTFSGIQDKYWGLNSFKMHLEYFGIIALVCAILAVTLCWKKRYVKFYVLAALVTVLVAIGSATPFFRIPYALIPGFRLFRAPALIFYLVSFSVIVLGAIGLENVLTVKQEMPARKMHMVSGTIVAVLIVIALVFSIGGNSIVQSMQDSVYSSLAAQWGEQTARAKISSLRANYSSLVSGTWRSVLLAIVTLGLIYFSSKRKLKLWFIAVLFVALALIDQLPLVSKFLPEVPAPEKYYAADDIVRFIKRDPGIFRVFPTPWYEHTTDLYLLYHNIQSAGGYIPNPLKRYQEFIGAGRSVMFSPANLIQHPRFIDMLNLKYVIAPTLPEDVSQYDPQTQRVIEQIRLYLSRFQKTFVGRKYTVYENRHAMPRAYLIHDYEVHNASEILNIIKSDKYDPWHTVLLEEDPHVPRLAPREDLLPTAVELTKYTPNEIVGNVESEYAGFLVLADNWHPDWQAFVDGEKTRVYVANHTFRAVYVRSGRHELVFRYVSTGFAMGKTVSIVTLFLALGLGVASLKRKF